MTPHWSDPAERQEFWQHRKAIADRQFRSGEITEAVYKATLFGLGYRGQELGAEANLVLMEIENDPRRLAEIREDREQA